MNALEISDVKLPVHGLVINSRQESKFYVSALTV